LESWIDPGQHSIDVFQDQPIHGCADREVQAQAVSEVAVDHRLAGTRFGGNLFHTDARTMAADEPERAFGELQPTLLAMSAPPRVPPIDGLIHGSDHAPRIWDTLCNSYFGYR